eukprot:Seg2170.2 transcript_id=Seg2170.2/GoldUCD/mRNA.D3Y31 product="hypothetical protein" protein_id=Seg2170.2/GoldUCD/D3Y31
MERRLTRWRITFLTILVFTFIGNGRFAEVTDKKQDVTTDDVSKQIEEKGKSIDVLSSLIEHSTDNMEDEIEKAGKDIDSPDAQKRIEIAGDDVDKLADEMDEKTEKEGDLIENAVEATPAVDSSETSKHTAETKTSEKADKHEEVHAKPVKTVTIISAFEKQEKLRQKMEDLLDEQGKKVEEIGDKMEKSRRNVILHKRNKQLSRSKKAGKLRNKLTKTRSRKKEKLVNKNATKRRVIIPVNRKKLEKLMLYYYITDKMKNGELNLHTLGKFFDEVKGLNLNGEQAKKSEPSLSSFAKVESSLNLMKAAQKENEKTSELGDVNKILKQFLKAKMEAEESEVSKRKEKETDLKSLVKSLENTDEKSSPPMSTVEDDATDNQDLKTKSGQAEAQPEADSTGSSQTEADRTNQAEAESSSSTPTEAESSSSNQAEADTNANGNAKDKEGLTTSQVHEMLDKIKVINATIFQNEKKKKKANKQKSGKRCVDKNCVGRALISFLDKALSAVKQETATEKTAPTEEKESAPQSAPKSAFKSAKEAPKITGETRSKGDPYAGIGFAELEDKGDIEDGKDAPGRERHLMAHSHDHHDDHHHDDHHHDDHHQGMFGGYRGYHGHVMPIRTNHRHDEYGYTEPLNVDTAPMHHYPNRHMHDHLDVDSMIRGHPYTYPHHTPDIALEGPISTAPVYEDMHHMLNGPGIHDQPDVHYEVEMHAHPNGEDMEHEIKEGVMDVEDVGRSIEDNVQRGVDRVTAISNHDVEAPDYDSEGHMEPTIHREDMQEDDQD